MTSFLLIFIAIYIALDFAEHWQSRKRFSPIERIKSLSVFFLGKKSIPQPATVWFIDSGLTVAFDENTDDGQQIPALQQPWFRCYVDWLISQGVNPYSIEFTFPDGRKAHCFKLSENAPAAYNWQFETKAKG